MKKKITIGIIILVILTAIFAIIHLTTRTPDIEGSVLVNGAEVKLSDLDYENVTGSVKNGKGEVKEIDADGIKLADILSDDYDTVKVTASDEYSATVSADEIDNAYLILEDGTLRLIVFGDENSKRDVKNVVRIDTE